MRKFVLIYWLNLLFITSLLLRTILRLLCILLLRVAGWWTRPSRAYQRYQTLSCRGCWRALRRPLRWAAHLHIQVQLGRLGWNSRSHSCQGNWNNLYQSLRIFGQWVLEWHYIQVSRKLMRPRQPLLQLPVRLLKHFVHGREFSRRFHYMFGVLGLKWIKQLEW